MASARRLDRPDLRNPIYQRVANAAETIRTDFARPLDLTGLAIKAGVSRSQLDRDVRRVFGVSPQTLQIQARMDEAFLLLKLDKSIVEIAHACGFTDQSAFSRRFRLFTGMSPGAWRALEASEQAGRSPQRDPAS